MQDIGTSRDEVLSYTLGRDIPLAPWHLDQDILERFLSQILDGMPVYFILWKNWNNIILRNLKSWFKNIRKRLWLIGPHFPVLGSIDPDEREDEEGILEAPTLHLPDVWYANNVHLIIF